MTETEAVPPILPVVTDLNRPFWDGCAAGVLRFQACLPAGHPRYPISDTCPTCLSREHEWRDASGDGEVLSAVVFQRGYHPAWQALVPYNVALVQLAEGPRMFSNILPLDRRDIRAGTRVHVVFDEVASGVAIPRFAPTAE